MHFLLESEGRQADQRSAADERLARPEVGKHSRYPLHPRGERARVHHLGAGRHRDRQADPGTQGQLLRGLARGPGGHGLRR